MVWTPVDRRRERRYTSPRCLSGDARAAGAASRWAHLLAYPLDAETDLRVLSASCRRLGSGGKAGALDVEKSLRAPLTGRGTFEYSLLRPSGRTPRYEGRRSRRRRRARFFCVHGTLTTEQCLDANIRRSASLEKSHFSGDPRVAGDRNFLYGEFDPGSGRTLAACLKHASRTGELRFSSGTRVSNT